MFFIYRGEKEGLCFKSFQDGGIVCSPLYYSAEFCFHVISRYGIPCIRNFAERNSVKNCDGIPGGNSDGIPLVTLTVYTN